MRRALFVVSLVAAMLLASCTQSTSPEDMTKTITVTITNPAHSLAANAGALGSAPATPGSGFTSKFTAPVGSRLSFSTMFVQSNDWFYAPDPEGIALYNAAGEPVTGDITAHIMLWDAGTELNEAIGSGPNQAPRQDAANTGPMDPDEHIRLVKESSGTFGSAPAGPGDSYSFEFDAPAGSKLSFATMYVQSNDWFYAPDPMGIDLYDAQGMAIAGDITSQVMLWDAGTEEDQPIGSGDNQAPRQSGPDTGPADTNPMIREVTDTAAGMNIHVMLAEGDTKQFKVTIEVLTDAKTPLAPGVWIVHSGGEPLFSEGAADRGMGLEALAEDGNNQMLADSLAAMTAKTRGNISASLTYANGMFTLSVDVTDSSATPIAPGVWYVHQDGMPLFESGMTDMGDGLEALAEDGSNESLLNALTAGAATTPLAPGVWAVSSQPMLLFEDMQPDFGQGLEALAEDGAPGALQMHLEDSGVSSGTFGSAPIGVGESYEFTTTIEKGQHLYFATMFVQSNDLFYAPGEDGLNLWDGDELVTGDVTSQVFLWDAGTEVNEIPGVGMNQAPRQSGPDTGVDEMGVVKMVDDGYSYPSAIQVTIAQQ